MYDYNVRIKDFGDGKKQYTIYDEPIRSTDDGLNKELERIKKALSDTSISDDLRGFYQNALRHVLGEIDKKEELIIHEDELIDEQLEIFQERKEKARLHSAMNNNNRAKNKIYDYARSNQWEWFLTFTFSPEKVNRSDYDECKKKLTKWLNNMSNKFCDGQLKYLVVPELHKDMTNWHFHGLFANATGIQFVDSGYIDDKGKIIYNVPQYRLGFTTATKISDTQKASAYICKYVTKQLNIKLQGKRRYLASNNLNVPKVEKIMISELPEHGKTDIFDKETSDLLKFKLKLKRNIKYAVWEQEKEYLVLGKTKKMRIIEIDENVSN